MALRNFCMDGTSSFASGTVVAQMIDASCSVPVIVVQPQAPHLPFVCLFVCLSVFNLPLTDEKYFTLNNNACATRRKCLREIGIPQGIYLSTLEAL